MSNDDIPFQILNLINNMNDKNEPDHIRFNYMMRLDSIQHTINQAIEKYKSDRAFFSNTNPTTKGKNYDRKKIS